MSSEQQQQQPVVVYQPRGRFLSKLGWIGFVVCLVILARFYAAKTDYFDTTAGISEKYHSGNQNATKKLAILTISGVIMDGSGFVKHQIDRIRKDKNVQAVVVRVNSPGGTVTGSDYILHHLKKLKAERQIPLVVSMGSIAASGGYYVSMAVGDQKESIFAEPTTTTGSIGVIIPHYDISGLLKRFDIVDDSIASHPRKQMLAMTRKMPEDHREILQGQVNIAFERFKKIIFDGRPKLRTEAGELKHGDKNLATGEVFWGPEAKQYGLVDRIGFLEDAIDRAMELANLDKKRVRVVRYESPASLFDLPAVVKSRKTADAAGLAALFELSMPRAYYLATSLPPLVRSHPR